MFYIATIADTLRIPPQNFSTGDDQSLINAITSKYPSRTITDVGVVVELFDVVTVGGAVIHAGDGGACFEVVFRVVVFKPFVGECITAKVTACTPEGINLSLDFFDNITVPYYNFFEPNHFDGEGKKWVWDDHQNDEAEGAGGEDGEAPDEDSQLNVRKGDLVRFVVDSVTFLDRTYSVKGVHTTETTADTLPGAAPLRKRSQSFEGAASFQEGNVGGGGRGEGGGGCVMNVVGSVKQDGLGKADWWEGEEEEEEGEGEEGGE